MGWKILQTFTPGSVSKETNIYGPDSINYYLNVINDTLKVFESSYSALFNKDIDFPLTDFEENHVQEYGWKTSISWAQYSYDTTGYILEHNQFNKTYPRLNILVRNHIMERDGAGKTYIYSKSAGLVRSTEYGGLKVETDGRGWDLWK